MNQVHRVGHIRHHVEEAQTHHPVVGAAQRMHNAAVTRTHHQRKADQQRGRCTVGCAVECDVEQLGCRGVLPRIRMPKVDLNHHHRQRRNERQQPYNLHPCRLRPLAPAHPVSLVDVCDGHAHNVWGHAGPYLIVQHVGEADGRLAGVQVVAKVVRQTAAQCDTQHNQCSHQYVPEPLALQSGPYDCGRDDVELHFDGHGPRPDHAGDKERTDKVIDVQEIRPAERVAVVAVVAEVNYVLPDPKDRNHNGVRGRHTQPTTQQKTQKTNCSCLIVLRNENVRDQKTAQHKEHVHRHIAVANAAHDQTCFQFLILGRLAIHPIHCPPRMAANDPNNANGANAIQDG